MQCSLFVFRSIDTTMIIILKYDMQHLWICSICEFCSGDKDRVSLSSLSVTVFYSPPHFCLFVSYGELCGKEWVKAGLMMTDNRVELKERQRGCGSGKWGVAPQWNTTHFHFPLFSFLYSLFFSSLLVHIWFELIQTGVLKLLHVHLRKQHFTEAMEQLHGTSSSRWCCMFLHQLQYKYTLPTHTISVAVQWRAISG